MFTAVPALLMEALTMMGLPKAAPLLSEEDSACATLDENSAPLVSGYL
jgi:hypothetical protein